MKPNIVADTNIYISAMAGSLMALRFFRAIEKGHSATLITSQKLWLEVEQTLATKPWVIKNADRRLVAHVQRIGLVHGSLRRDPQLRNPVSLASDPKDDYLLALAASTGSVLVTGDGPLVSTRPKDIAVVSLGQAVSMLESAQGLQVSLANRNGQPYMISF